MAQIATAGYGTGGLIGMPIAKESGGEIME